MQGYLRWYLRFGAVTAAVFAGAFVSWNDVGVHDSDAVRVPAAVLGAGMVAGGVFMLWLLFLLVSINSNKPRQGSRQKRRIAARYGSSTSDC